MQNLVTAGVALGAWILTIVKVGTLRRGSRDRRILSLWAFFVLFAVSSTLHIEPLQRAMDLALRTNGVTMFLASMLLVLAFYCLCTSCYIAIVNRSPGWMPLYLVITMVLLTVIFALTGGGTVGSAALLSLTIKHTYGIVMFSRIVALFGPSCRNEKTETVRVRICLVCLAALLVIAFLALRPFADWLNLVGAPKWLVVTLEALSLCSLIGAGGVWPLGFVPNKLLSKLAQPLLLYEKWSALQDLKRLQSDLGRLCPEVTPIQGRWWELIADVDLHLYQTVIAILDSRSAFASWLEGQAPGEDEPRRDRAIYLRDALQNIEDGPFDSLVLSLRGIAKGSA
jgi:hypothetical protein